MAKKKGHGGRRPGAGRKPSLETGELRTVVVTFRVAPSEMEAIREAAGDVNPKTWARDQVVKAARRIVARQAK